MVRRVGVLSNPRSGTSLMVRLLVLGFDLRNTMSLFPHLPGNNVYEYRADPKDLKSWADLNYHAILVTRDPRAVITSKHPSSPNEFLIGFGEWQDNYRKCLSLKDTMHVVEVKYEELLSAPSESQTYLSGRLSLPARLPFAEAASTDKLTNHEGWDSLTKEMGGARPLQVSKSIRWKQPEFRSRLKEQLELFPFLVEVLIELGYEDSDDWVRELYV